MKKKILFILFFSIAATVYGVMNYFFINKLNQYLIIPKPTYILLWIILLIIILSLVTHFIFSFNERPKMASITGFIGYSWLAFLLLFLSIHGILDIIFLIVGPVLLPFLKTTFIIVVGLSLIIIVYGYFEANRFQLKKVRLTSHKLIKTGKIKILHLSDIHFSPLVSLKLAHKIKDVVNMENPDLIVCTGDLLDPGIRYKEEVAQIMNSLKVPLGKFAILGNHEVISGLDYSEQFSNLCGFQFLRNKGLSLNDEIYLAGVDDPTTKQMGLINNIPEGELQVGLNEKQYNILLKHIPTVHKKNRFDLQLSGHTHGGQIFPFTLLVKLAFPKIAGLYNLGNNRHLYVSRGAGTWGPPIRFLAPAEITLIEIV